MSENKFTYEVVEAKDDPRLSVLVKKGVEVQFTMSEIEAHEQQLEKALREARATVDVHAAQMVNIETHHPFVKEFDAEQLHTLQMYITALRQVETFEPQIKKIEEAQAEYNAEKAEITKQCDLPPVKEDLKDSQVVGMTVEEVLKDKPDEQPE